MRYRSRGGGVGCLRRVGAGGGTEQALSDHFSMIIVDLCRSHEFARGFRRQGRSSCGRSHTRYE
jgi:hypothetical protein